MRRKVLYNALDKEDFSFMKCNNGDRTHSENSGLSLDSVIQNSNKDLYSSKELRTISNITLPLDNAGTWASVNIQTDVIGTPHNSLL